MSIYSTIMVDDIFSNITDELCEGLWDLHSPDTITDLIHRVHALNGSLGMTFVINNCLMTANIFPYLSLLISLGGQNTQWTVETLTPEIDGVTEEGAESYFNTLRSSGITI